MSRTIPKYCVLVFVAILVSLIGAPVWAAQCDAIYSEADGVNDNLLASGDTFELSWVDWADNSWPPSGATLSEGDYFFEGTSLGNNYALDVEDGAQVRIFVDGNLTAGNNLELNVNGSPDQLVLVVDGNVSVNNNSQINGLVYATGTLSMNNNNDVNGALAAEGAITLGNTNVSYDPAILNQAPLQGLCGDPVTVLVNGESEGPVEIEVDGDIELEAIAVGCDDGASLWRNTWEVDGPGSSTEQAVTGASPCEAQPVTPEDPDFTDVFSAPGTYTVTFVTEFCGFGTEGICNFFGLWDSHGTDSILVEVVDPGAPTECFLDDFERTELGDDWVTDVASGGFTPQIVTVNGDPRLRMTEAEGDQATAATLQRRLPAADNLVVLEFDYFAYGGTGADGLSIVLSDAAISPQAGGFGGSLGYAQRSDGGGIPGFAGGWIGVGLDEFGNFSNPTEGREGGPGSVPDAVALRGSGSGSEGYAYIDGTGSLSPGIDDTGSDNPHRYRITVDSTGADTAFVIVERAIDGSDFESLIGPIDVLGESGQDEVPEDFLLSLTGSTGGSTNIHELGNLELCALEIEPVGEQIDHFELEFGETALTCQPHEVEIRACQNEDCSALFEDPVEVTMEPSGWVGGDTFTFSGGETTERLQKTNIEEQNTFELDVASSEPTKRPFTDNLCRRGNGPLDADQCELTFFDSGLALEIPNQTANRVSEEIEIQAVQRDDETNECIPAFSDVAREVDFWSEYIEPDTGTMAVNIGTMDLDINDKSIGQSESDGTPVMLNFDSSGTAKFELLYPDAGRMELNALYTGSEATEDEGLVMPGDNLWTSVPQGLCVETPFECEAADETCNVATGAGEEAPTVAGEEFDLTLRAVGWDDDGNDNLCEGNPPTPNFELSGITLGHQLVAPADGVAGTLGLSQYDHQLDSDGEKVVQQSISEVGVFRFSATPTSGAYFGETVPGGESEPAGRFTPDHFTISVTDPGSLEEFCDVGDSFTYSGQGMEWADEPEIQITARNLNDDVTQNYTESGFMNLDPADGVVKQEAQEDNSALDLNDEPYPVQMDLNTGEFVSQMDGQIDYLFDQNDETTYLKSPETRIDPIFPDLTVAIEDVQDGDGVSAADVPVTFNPESLFELRYGRLRLENAFGPETRPLIVPMRAEYWNEGEFVLNTDEDGVMSSECWEYNPSGSELNESFVRLEPGSVAENISTDDAFGLDMGRPDQGLDPTERDEEDGRIWLRSLSDEIQPGDDNQEGVTFVVPKWLQDDFDGDGDLGNPKATATFGVYRGHDRIIHWREVR